MIEAASKPADTPEYSDQFIRALFTEDAEILGIPMADLSRLKSKVMVADPDRYMGICWQVRHPEAEAQVDRRLAKLFAQNRCDEVAFTHPLGHIAADS